MLGVEKKLRPEAATNPPFGGGIDKYRLWAPPKFSQNEIKRNPPVYRQNLHLDSQTHLHHVSYLDTFGVVRYRNCTRQVCKERPKELLRRNSNYHAIFEGQ